MSDEIQAWENGTGRFRIVYQFGEMVTCIVKDERFFLCSDHALVATLLALGWQPVSDEPYYFRGRATWVFEGDMPELERLAGEFFASAAQPGSRVTTATFRIAFAMMKALMSRMRAGREVARGGRY